MIQSLYSDIVVPNNLDVFQFKSGNRSVKQQSWNRLNQDSIGIIASFGHMLPNSTIDKFIEGGNGIFVIHPSLLPKYRGACPIQHAILNQERQTGVSIVQTSKQKFDAGRILAQKSIQLSLQSKYINVLQECANLGAQLLYQSLPEFQSIRKEAKKQQDDEKTRAPLIKQASFGLLPWDKKDSKEIVAHFNALYGSHIKAKSNIEMKFNNEGRVKTRGITFKDLRPYLLGQDINNDKIIKNINNWSNNIPNGAVHWQSKLSDNHIFIKCKGEQENSWVISQQLMLSGDKQFLSAKQFVRKHLKGKSYKPSDPLFRFICK